MEMIPQGYPVYVHSGAGWVSPVIGWIPGDPALCPVVLPIGKLTHTGVVTEPACFHVDTSDAVACEREMSGQLGDIRPWLLGDEVLAAMAEADYPTGRAFTAREVTALVNLGRRGTNLQPVSLKLVERALTGRLGKGGLVGEGRVSSAGEPDSTRYMLAGPAPSPQPQPMVRSDALTRSMQLTGSMQDVLDVLAQAGDRGLDFPTLHQRVNQARLGRDEPDIARDHLDVAVKSLAERRSVQVDRGRVYHSIYLTRRTPLDKS